MSGKPQGRPRGRPRGSAPITLPKPLKPPKKIEEILDDLDFRQDLREEAEERATARATARADEARAEADAAMAAAADVTNTAKTPKESMKNIAKDEAGAQSPSPFLVAPPAPNGTPHADEDLDDTDEDDDLDEDDEDLDDEDGDDDDDDEEDEDDDLDDDDDADDDDADDDEPQAKAPTKRLPTPKPAAKAKAKAPARAPLRPPPRALPMDFGPPGVGRLPAKFQQDKIRENLSEYDEMLASIDFDSSKNHRILLVRVKPEWDVASGKRLAGYLEEFRKPVTPEEIRAKHGGGEYTLTLQGPSGHDGGGRIVFKKQKNIEISGDPIVPNSPRSAASVAAAAAATKATEDSGQLALVKQVMESKERDTQRLWAEQQDLKKMLLQTMSKNDSGIKDVVATALNGGGDLRREMLEERRIQEDRMRSDREERQRELDRLASERKRELELAQATHERQLEMMRLQSERQIEQMRLEQQRMVEELRSRTASEATSGRDLLLFMQKMESEKSATQQRQQEIFLMQQQKQQELATAQATKQQDFLLQQQMQGQQMLMSQMQSTQQTKETFLMEMLKESRGKKDDFFSTVEKMQQFKQLMASMNGGGEEDSRERWEKVLDRVGEAAPGIVAVASSFMQSRQQQQQQQQAPQQQEPQQAQRVLPGSVAFADVEIPMPQLPPARKPKPAPVAAAAPPKPKPAPKPAPVAPKPKTAAPAPKPAVKTSAVLEATQPAQEGANTLTDFVFPADGLSLPEAIPLLVQNIDLAIQRDLSAQRIYDEVVSKFPLEVLTVLKLASADQMVEILEQRAPGSWIINSLVGTRKIEELHAILVGR